MYSHLEKQYINEHLEEALYLFDQIDHNTLSGNPPFSAVTENIDAKIDLLKQAQKNLIIAMGMMVESVEPRQHLFDKNDPKQQEDQQLLEQAHSTLDEIFDRFKRFIEELKNTTYYYGAMLHTARDGDSYLTWQLIKDTIKGIMSHVPKTIPQNYFAPLLQHIANQLNLVTIKLDQRTLESAGVEVIKEQEAQRQAEAIDAQAQRQATREAANAATRRQREIAELTKFASSSSSSSSKKTGPLALIRSYITQAQQAFTASKEFSTAQEYQQKFFDGLDFVRQANSELLNLSPAQQSKLRDDFDILLDNVHNLLNNLIESLRYTITREHLDALGEMTYRWGVIVDMLNDTLRLQHCTSYEDSIEDLEKRLDE